MREHFLSPAGHNLFSVLKTTLGDKALIAIKVGLGDLFEARSKDPGEFRIYRNKIDRRHVTSLWSTSSRPPTIHE